MPVVGTGGHVDHGKSTLVQALTGRDPDRWREEKERGLTIDLGFAWARIGRQEVSFVDVPGHERFMKNMLAGSGGFDVALLVVAADEGWMPQSEEHLAVLDLLDIRHGLVALTKTDRADADLIELATLEVEERLSGTSLEGCPIVAVSAVTGDGLDDLRAALAGAIAGMPAHRSKRTRLWIDRVFPMAGAGTVVTGTLVGGSIAVGDEVEVLPGAVTGRVRSLQAHEAERDRIEAGTRTAAGVAGLDRGRVARGWMLGRPGEWVPSDRFLVTLRSARYVNRPLSRRGAYQMHLGSGAWPVRLFSIGEIDDRTVGVLRTEQPVPVRMGDRFVLRDVGRRLIVAGGQIVEPVAPRKGRDARRAAASLQPVLEQGPDRRAGALLEWRGTESPAVLAAHSGGGRPDRGVVAGRSLLSEAHADRLARRARTIVARFHEDNPLRPGMPKASLASALRVDIDTLAAVLPFDGRLGQHESVVALAGFLPELDRSGEEEWERIRTDLESAGPMVPRLKEMEIDPELLHALLREGRLVRISEELAYLPPQVEALVDRLADLPERFTVAEFRDTTGLTRKYAVPFLEWADRRGITTRYGNERSVNR
ncbi:MAG: selenocysteine-specific translation elongation factor [Acidimicrobiia bacterium]|nr:selenocysteine-specific translation elongation factor [Acidimicrobiia bacterium]MYC84185.1 selenocysteine-specific translation elongation factor [Acidimicrobiia bacterium]